MSKSKEKGTWAETQVTRYLRQWWPGAERRALAGALDKGDIAGIPGVAVEVKARKQQALPTWRRETWREMQNAKADFCILVVHRPFKPVSRWDAYIPYDLLPWDDGTGGGEKESEQWARMDLRLAALLVLEMTAPPSPSPRSSATTA